MKVLDEIGSIGQEDSSSPAIPYSFLTCEDFERERYEKLLLDFKTIYPEEERLRKNNQQDVQRRLIELMGSYLQHHDIHLNERRIYQTCEKDQHIIYNSPRVIYSKFLQGEKHIHFFEQNNKLCVTSSMGFYSPLDWDHREKLYSKISSYLLVRSLKDNLLPESTSRKIVHDENIVYVAPLDNLPIFVKWTTRVAPHLIQVNIEDYCGLYEAYQRVSKERKGDKPNSRELILKQHLKNSFELEMNRIRTIMTNRDLI